MKHLSVLNKYLWKYRWRFLFGVIFIVLSNYFRILAPQLTGFILDSVEKYLPGYTPKSRAMKYDALVSYFIERTSTASFNETIAVCGISILVLAFLGGLFMFFMRQTIIVMSRHIEFDQKNEIYQHYQQLDMGFYKRHSTGDLMNRITEDVSRVRMYTGPAIMYFINLAATIGFCVFYMWQKDPVLTLYVLSPLPVLAITIYYVNNIINHKSERIQSLLSDLTTSAQESYSGIRVIKSFVQEKAMLGFFSTLSQDYRKNAVGLAKVESIYFPAMSLMIGLSTLLTIMIGGIYSLNGDPNITTGTIAEFVMYVNLMSFPVSAIGLTASMTQRAAASQRRINEFLQTDPLIQDFPVPVNQEPDGHKATMPPAAEQIQGTIHFDKVDFTYPDTGIQALKNFSLHIQKGQKIAVIGRTGSGKTTLAQLLLRMYDPSRGSISIDGVNLKYWKLRPIREQISYVPQDVFLFSDSVTRNIEFGLSRPVVDGVIQAARSASVHQEILGFSEQYDTIVGERGVTLSGGQKQRISIARALIKDPQIVIFDDCLSAVDARTEKEIISNLYRFLEGKTSIIITHRIFSMFDFDNIIVLDQGRIIEQGSHQQLLAKKGYYAHLYQQQQEEAE